MQGPYSLFILTLCGPILLVSCHGGEWMSSELQRSMLKSMGLSKFPPKVQKNKISLKTYEKAKKNYKKSIQQTLEQQAVIQALQGVPPDQRSHEQSISKPIRIGSGIKHNHRRHSTLDFEYIKFDLKVDAKSPTLVESAIFSLDIEFQGPKASVEISQVLSLNAGGEDDLIYLDKVFFEEREIGSKATTFLSLSPAAQHWIQHPTENRGLKVICRNCDFLDVGDLELKLLISDAPSNPRSKRASESSDLCSSSGPHKSNRCCRHSMQIDLLNITGFDFILHPKSVDAFYCHGRCPHRFNPINDHSIFQSMMHLRTKNLPPGQQIPRPCCAPSQLQPLDVLHASEDEEHTLKVTKWKDVIVTSCACA